MLSAPKFLQNLLASPSLFERIIKEQKYSKHATVTESATYHTMINLRNSRHRFTSCTDTHSRLLWGVHKHADSLTRRTRHPPTHPPARLPGPATASNPPPFGIQTPPTVEINRAPVFSQQVCMSCPLYCRVWQIGNAPRVIFMPKGWCARRHHNGRRNRPESAVCLECKLPQIFFNAVLKIYQHFLCSVVLEKMWNLFNA